MDVVLNEQWALLYYVYAKSIHDSLDLIFENFQIIFYGWIFISN
jgi:hypothetical protein